MRNSSPRTALSPFKRYWWVTIPAFLATMGGALVYLTLASRVYEATVRLSVEDDRASVSNIGQTLTETDELGGANPIVTQAEVVRSQGVLRAA
ncbi:MAG: Wzz/FepE/Etk N-terminal domain-containing protein, partial [Cyanobacteria bacterium J06649_4]